MREAARRTQLGSAHILQGIDAAGKDSAIKRVMAGANSQGCIVRPFKMPTTEELDHNLLWRAVKRLPRHCG